MDQRSSPGTQDFKSMHCMCSRDNSRPVPSHHIPSSPLQNMLMTPIIADTYPILSQAC